MYREHWKLEQGHFGILELTGTAKTLPPPDRLDSANQWPYCAEDLACFSPESLRHRTREERAAEERQKRTASAPLLLPGLPPLSSQTLAPELPPVALQTNLFPPTPLSRWSVVTTRRKPSDPTDRNASIPRPSANAQQQQHGISHLKAREAARLSGAALQVAVL